MFGGYLFLRFKDGREIRQINPLQTLMNLQYMPWGNMHARTSATAPTLQCSNVHAMQDDDTVVFLVHMVDIPYRNK